MLSLSAVVVARNESGHLRATVENLRATLPPGAEMVVVDDGSTDGCADFLERDGGVLLVRGAGLGVAGARNLGARLASGEVMVFCDAHVAAPPGWWRPMLEVLASPPAGAAAPGVFAMGDEEARGYGQRLRGPQLTIEWLPRDGNQPRRAPLLPGCFLAVRRDAFQAAGGFDGGMRLWGSEDTELSIRLWLLGYELWLVPEVEVAHLFRLRHPYEVEWEEVLHNRLRMALAHFSARRVSLAVEALREQYGFSRAWEQARAGDVSGRRQARLHDDDWYFEQLGPRW